MDLSETLRGAYGRAIIDDVNDILVCADQINEIRAKLERVNTIPQQPLSRQDLMEILNAVESLTMKPGVPCMGLQHSVRDAIDFIKFRMELG